MINDLFAPMADSVFWLKGLVPFFFALATMTFLNSVIIQTWMSIGDENVLSFVFLLGVVSYLAFLTLKNVAIFFFSVFLSLSGGQSKVEEWLENDFIGGILFSLRFGGIAVAALIPGFLTVQFGRSIFGPLPFSGDFESVAMGTTMGIGEQLTAVFTIFHPSAAVLIVLTLLLFPVFFLSTQQLDVPFSPISPDILRSFGSCFGAWFGFYLWTFLLIGLPLYVVCVLPFGAFQIFLAPFASGLLIPLYAVILGRLGWILEDVMRD